MPPTPNFMSDAPEIETRFTTATGTFTLQRLPVHHHPSLRAWDAADDYLIATLQTEGTDDPGSILMVNDSFGALTIALHTANPTLWYDSAVEADALAMNLEQNQLPPIPVVAQTEPPPAASSQVVVKLPRSSALLDWQLAMLNHHLPVGTPIWLGGMLKHVTPADQKVMQHRLGDVQASRIVRKARIWQAVTTKHSTLPIAANTEVPGFDLSLCNHPGGFSPKRLDPGAACLLAHLDQIDLGDMPDRPRVIDLCCGNGVLGLAWMKRHPLSELTLTDASAAAVTSARQSATRNLPSDSHWAVLQQNGLLDAAYLNADLILCNPPFHQADTITTDVARQLFHQARLAVHPNGTFVVVANRHLGYHQVLKSYFARVNALSRDSRFVVLQATGAKPWKG